MPSKIYREIRLIGQKVDDLVDSLGPGNGKCHGGVPRIMSDDGLPEAHYFDYLVVHPTDLKWVITLVINGISGGNAHL